MAGWASSEFAWKTGKTYTYAVRGRLMTGISEINTQYSGMEMDYKMILTVLDRNTILLKPTEFRIVEVHDKLFGGWRDAELKGERPVDMKPEFLRFLESPIELTLNRGVIDTIKVEKELPVWAVNIKKAQVSHFVLDTTGVRTVLEGNLNRNVEHLHQDYPTLESGRFYETLEKTIHGECKTYYTVSQNGPFVKPFPFQRSVQAGDKINSEETIENLDVHDKHDILRGELSWHKTFHHFCHEDDQVFEIIKSVNFTTCVNKPVLGFLSPSVSTNARAGDNTFGSFGLRAVVSRFLACGKTRKEFTILKIRQEEQINVGLHHTEKLIAGSIKNLTLIEVTERRDVPKLRNPVVIPTLVYKFVHNKVHNVNHFDQEMMMGIDTPYMTKNIMDMDVSEEEELPRFSKINNEMINNEEVLPKPNLIKAPLNSMLVSPLKIDGMKKRIVVLMREIVDDMMMKSGKESIAEKETLSKMSVVAKILRYFNYEDIEEVYNTIANKKNTVEDRWFHHIFLNLVCVSGTNPNIKFVFDLIQKRVITGEIAAQIMMTLPMYIRTPTKELLKEYFKLIQILPTEIGHRQLKTTSILSFTTLLHQACVNTNLRNTRYPVHMYGTFCDEKFVETEFLDHFVKELERVIYTDNTDENTHWKVTYLTALGNIGHPKIIPVVQKLMDNIVNPFIKVKAVYMLKHLIVSRSNQNIRETTKVHGVDRDSIDCVTDELIEKRVLPILVSVAMDKGEHPEVRMAAISLIMYTTNADITIWQQLAYMTWFEVSEQVRSFVYTSFRCMAGLEKPLGPIHWKVQMKARSVLSLCKPIKMSLIKSHNIFGGDHLENHLSGFFYQLSTFGSVDSMIPNNIYFRNYNQFADGAFGVNPIELSIHGHSTQRLLNYFIEKIWTPSTMERTGHEDLLQIREILGIKERKMTDKVVGSIYLKIRNEMERLFTLNKHKIDRLMKEFNDVTLPHLKNGLPIEWHKTLHLGENLIEIPSIFGIPFTYKYEMPVHMSLKGNVKFVRENNAMQLQADLHPVYAWKMHHKVSFKVPFVHKKYQSGVEQHMVMEFPFRTLIGRGDRGQYIFALTPTHLHETTPTTELNLITFHCKPYTAIVKDSLWPIHKTEGAELKMIHSVETPIKMDHHVGEKVLGLSLRFETESEYKEETESLSSWMRFVKSFKTPTGLLNLGYLGQPMVRRCLRKITLDMSKSETKTLVFVLGGKKNVEMRENLEDIELMTRKDSSEEHRDVEKLGHVYALAVIGKKTPIVRCEETHGIQKILVKGTPSTVHYLMHWMWSNEKLNLRWSIGEAVKEACTKLREDIPSLLAIREVLMDSTVEQTELTYCMELRGLWDRPTMANPRELVILRQRLLAEDLIVKMKHELHFGKTCSNMPHKIMIEGLLKRDNLMTEWAREKSLLAKKCIEDERKGFTVSPVCLLVADQQAAALNDIKLEIQWTELPVTFKRVCYLLQDTLKHILYPYMTHDRFPIEGGAGDKKMIVNWRMIPTKEYMHMTIVKPETRLIFKNIRIHDMLKKFLPLTATQTIVENVRERTLRTYFQPTCTLEKNFISTFDNVTYKFSKDVAHNCEHVLTKDCSGKFPMAVLVRNIHTDTKVVTILLGGKTKIEILPVSGMRFLRNVEGKVVVKVNGEVVENLPKTIHLVENKEKFLAKIEKMVNGGIQVITPRVRVATDLTRVVVIGHNDYRNRTCGLCGNFDGEKIAELRSPKNCPLSTGSLLVASYAFPPLHTQERNTCVVRPEIKKLIVDEEQDCLKSRRLTMTEKVAFFDDESMESTKTIMDDMTLVNDDTDCYLNERLSREVEHLGVCRTEKKILKCKPECFAKDVQTKKLWFDCFDRTFVTPMSNSIRKQLWVEVPTKCVREL